MKKVSFYVLTALVLSVSACNNNSKESNTAGIEISDKETTATFTVDGTAYKGKVSTQYFGSNKETDNFSVVCQQDEPLVLLQAVFANQKDAASADLKPKGGSYKVSAGEFDLALTMPGAASQFTSNEKSGGAIKVDGNTMTITAMKLFDADGKEKTVSGTINF